jgi:signal transduction histidine kinase
MEFKKLNILIVDDDEIDQRLLKRAITKSDLLAEITIVDTPSLAINSLKDDKFDCCFIDYLMPLMNGIELVNEIRKFDKETPLIIVTSQSDQELSQKSINAGATNYITKSLINPEGVSLLLRNSLHLQKIENELREAKNEALKLAQIKQDFLANMSHEIRTPLNAINGFTDLLRQTQLSEEQNKYVDILNVASRNLSNLINDILDVSKIESGELNFENNSISLTKITENVILIEGVKAKSKGILLTADIDANLPSLVMGDQTRVMQVILNLVSNAIKFTDKGEVKIKLSEKERKGNTTTVIISIIDSGIGIPEDKLKKIFERFTQAENSTTRLYGGTGLGLNIVKNLVELMYGNIQLKSELGKGSQFILEIPFEIAINDHENNQIKKVNSVKSLSDMSILVVEDNEHNQLLIGRYLEKNGAEVTIANHGKEAILLLEAQPFSLILMDLQMPVMDGFETTSHIREVLKLTIPIIACSASSSIKEEEICKSKGMDHYIAKPFTEKKLVESISKIKYREQRVN